MSKKLFTILLAAGIAVFFTASGIQAGTEVGDVVTMESKLFDKRKKGPDSKKPYELVQFTHKKHHEEYKISCGDCHHDKDGKPLELKAGDDVQKCEACHTHKKAKKENKTFQGNYKNKPVDIMHLESAIHENCIGCHVVSYIEKGMKEVDAKKKAKKCTICHKKK